MTTHFNSVRWTGQDDMIATHANPALIRSPDQPWLWCASCGRGLPFGAADIGIHWAIHIARMIGAVDFDEMKNVARYMAQVDARPAAKIAYAIPPGYVREPPGSAVTPARVRRH